METPRVIAEMRIVGGNPALDLVNTRDTAPDGEPGFDRLRDYDHLLAWADRAGIISSESARRAGARAAARSDEASAALGQARALRADIYDVFNALALERDPPVSSLTSLRRIHGEAIAHGSLVRRDDAFTWDWSENEELVAVLWPVVHAAVELLTSNKVQRVKRCNRCSWLFVDATKNRSRRWCSMEGCGTNEKSERFVQRRRAQRRGPATR
jgi:predicted RNA-binding Zn ribbon-like protein